MAVIEGKNCNVDKQYVSLIWPPEGFRPLNFVTFDESTFSAHDGLKCLSMLKVAFN